MPLFYALTLFVSAFLLFLVQPLVGKMLLPMMGGTPVVWNTCMVFFQAMLLGGYLYSYASTKYLDVRRQTLVHIGVLLVTLAALIAAAVMMGQPIVVSERLSPQGEAIPVFGMMLVLLLAIGLPFFTVATSAPLLQRWFSGTRHASARDPYFLYGASNLGSILAMLAYPALLEPKLRLAEQSWLWAGGFLVLAVMIGACAWSLWRSPALSLPVARAVPAKPQSSAPPLTWSQRFHWAALAFVPSSLMLGVTTYLVTDIASIPLLWIVPLGLYLLTFIVAFPPLPGGVEVPKTMLSGLTLVTPVLVLLLLFQILSHFRISTSLAFALNLATFLAVGLTCHCTLARSRPAPERLTEFFLVVSVGGVLGGLFNALVAPLVFNGIHEYKVALACACLVLPALTEVKRDWRSIALDAAAVVGVFLLATILTHQVFKESRFTWSDYKTPIVLWRRPTTWVADALASAFSWFGSAIGTGWAVSPENFFKVLQFGIPALVCYVFVDRPIRFGLCVGALLLAVNLGERRPDMIYQERSFFGVLHINEEVLEYDGEREVYHELVHGTTVHGRQRVEALTPEATQVPLSYYHKTGPIGELFGQFSGPTMKRRLAVIGLGTGTTAAYAGAGQSITYYEIDPLVERIATDPKYFSYYTSCQAEKKIVMGDARVQMQRNQDGKYGMIIVDAFSSDSIPVHLLTKQALEMYLEHLEPDGVLVLHISNRYLNLRPVVARLARELKLTALLCEDDSNESNNKTASNWVVTARNIKDLGQLPELAAPNYLNLEPQTGRRYGLGAVGGGLPPLKVRDRWVRMEPEPGDPLWTDDFSNLLRIMEWR